MKQMIERYCLRDNLATDDPYDVWKAPLGFAVKRLFNSSRALGLAPAALLSLWDTFINNRRRIGYRRQEYPVVRAFAALTLLNRYQADPHAHYLEYARLHLEWLVRNRSSGIRGMGWGLGFEHAVRRGLVHPATTAYSTMTPYVLEAFVGYQQASGDNRFAGVIDGIRTFFQDDIQVMLETDDVMATSYAPMRDRVVVNAVSYAMFSRALLWSLDSKPDPGEKNKVLKLYEFVRRMQRPDGSWLYSPEGKSFIDCFHSCIVLKNLIKTSRLLELPASAEVIDKGYGYLKTALYDAQKGLFRRFALTNKPGLVAFDLYDNAEMLNLAYLTGDRSLAVVLSASIHKHFCRDDGIYSQIDRFGNLRNRDMLRWAVMPYVFALSQLEQKAATP